MDGRSGGLIGEWADAQRQQQRQREARLRLEWERERDAAREQRARERDMARMERGRQAEYRRWREAEALRLTDELESRVEVLSGLLVAGCEAPAFRASSLLRAEPAGDWRVHDERAAGRQA